MAWLSGWNYRKTITVSASSVDTDLTAFPLAIPLATTSLDGHALANGHDIRITQSDGSTLIPHYFNGYTGAGYSGVKTLVPTIDADNGVELYLYYGRDDASDVSSKVDVLGEYAFFAPLDGYTSGQAEDANGYSLLAGGEPVAATGVIGGGVTIDAADYIYGGIDDYYGLVSALTVPDMAVSMVLQNWTWVNTASEVAFNIGSFSSGQNAFSLQLRPSTRDVRLQVRPGGDALTAEGASGKVSADDLHLSATLGISGTTLTAKVYVDGALKGTNTATVTETNLDFTNATQKFFRIGYTSIYGVHGVVDEVRIRKAATSDAWLKFEAANLMVAGNQITLGAEESRSGVPIALLMGGAV